MFLSFHEQTISQVAEQTIYFPKFAEQSFFHNPPPPPQESNGRPLTRPIDFKKWTDRHDVDS